MSSVPTALGEMPGEPGRGPRRGVAPDCSGARLRWIRVDAGWSPGGLAALVRQAGRELGRPNDCNGRMVLEWEEGGLADCDPVYRNALVTLPGLRSDLLCSLWVECPATPAVLDVAAVGAAGRKMRALAGVPGGVLLRWWRSERRLDQRDLADLVQRFGESIGEPNACTRRLVQKWESGEHATVSSDYVGVLSRLTGIPANVLSPPCDGPWSNIALMPSGSTLERIDIFLTLLREGRFTIAVRRAGDAALPDSDQPGEDGSDE